MSDETSRDERRRELAMESYESLLNRIVKLEDTADDYRVAAEAWKIKYIEVIAEREKAKAHEAKLAAAILEVLEEFDHTVTDVAMLEQVQRAIDGAVSDLSDAQSFVNEALDGQS